MLIPPPPKHISNTRIYQHLLAKSSSEDGIVERARVFVETATPLVDLIASGPFREYTLHNRNHSKKILHLSGHFISPKTLEELTPLEALVLLYASFLHDMGLTVTFTDRNRILKSEEFLDSFRSWRELWSALKVARERLALEDERSKLPIEAEIFQLQEAAISNYLRPLHATPERYREFIDLIKKNSEREDLFSLNGVSFEEVLIEICASHNLAVQVLGELCGAHEERFPRSLPIGGQRLNTQFCAAVLRISDILDFDRERTPRILFESLGIKARTIPGAEISLQEWKKHLSVHTIDITDEEVVIFGESEHPAIERAIRDFCVEIEREIRETLAILRRNPSGVREAYQLQLPASVRPSIRSKGYVYKNFILRLDEGSIMTLLMGHELYSEPAVAVRELVQNSVDACNLRSRISRDSEYVPKVSVFSKANDEGRVWLIVRDNGIGMDEYVLANFFFNVGKSYYDSVEFERMVRTYRLAPFRPVSRFGIGILSVFMIGDILEIYTRSAYSMHGDHMGRTVRVEKMGSLAYVTEATGGPLGTEVRVRLKSNQIRENEVLLDRISEYLGTTVLRPPFQIDVTINGKSHTISPGSFYAVLPSAKVGLAKNNIEIVDIDVGRWSDILSGSAILFFGVGASSRSLHHLLNGKQIGFSLGFPPERHFLVDPNSVIDRYEGNRISVNGFRMGLKGISRLFRRGNTKERIAAVVDIEVSADRRVNYDVSRRRIIQSGVSLVRHELRNAIVGALDDLGYIERMSDETKECIRTGKDRTTQIIPVVNEALLGAVERCLPDGEWPKGLHRIIAERLGISNSLAFRSISTLLARRRVAES